MFIERYNPLQTPDAEQWLQMDEQERLALVLDFHDKESDEDDELEDEQKHLHAAIHVVVENQLAMATPMVAETVARMRRQGLDRHDAVHAVGAVLAGDIFELLKGKAETWQPQRYRRRLEKLTAKRWRKGQV